MVLDPRRAGAQGIEYHPEEYGRPNPGQRRSKPGLEPDQVEQAPGCFTGMFGFNQRRRNLAPDRARRAKYPKPDLGIGC